MKKILLLTMFLLSIPSFAKIEISIFEPIRFKYFNTRDLGTDKIVGEGIIQITTDNKKEDIGKKLIFDFPKSGLITNRKKWVKIEKYHLELPEKELIITQETEHIKFYAILDRRDIDRGENANIIEGDYIGYVPIVISQYSKLPVEIIPAIPIVPAGGTNENK